MTNKKARDVNLKVIRKFFDICKELLVLNQNDALEKYFSYLVYTGRMSIKVIHRIYLLFE